MARMRSTPGGARLAGAMEGAQPHFPACRSFIRLVSCFFFGGGRSVITDDRRSPASWPATLAMDTVRNVAPLPDDRLQCVGTGLFEPDFGALWPAHASRPSSTGSSGWRHLCSRCGQSPAHRPGSINHLVDGETLAADRSSSRRPVVPSIFPTVLGDRIFVTRQECSSSLARRADGSRAGDARWADFNMATSTRLPDLEGGGQVRPRRARALGRSRHPIARADSFGSGRDHRLPDRRFPLLRGAPLTESRVCQYENSSNGDFLIDRHPELANVVLSAAAAGTASAGPRSDGSRLTRRGRRRPVRAAFTLATKAGSKNAGMH